MVQLIDFERLDVIKIKEDELKIIDITIDKNGLLDLSMEQLYNELFAVVHEKMAATTIIPTDNLWIEMNIKDNTIGDDNSLYFLCANIIATNLLVGKLRNREMRLKVPPLLNTDGLFGFIWLKRMINEKLICDKIGGIIRINGDEVKIV